MKGIVIYKGKYGATKQYAVWIGQELGLTVALPIGSRKINYIITIIS